jgi:hypothetical protein
MKREIELVMAFDERTESTSNYFELLQEIIEEFRVEIIGLWPMSPSGAWPEIKFRGEADDIYRLCLKYHNDDEEEARYYYDDYSTESTSDEINILKDDRWPSKNKWIDKDGNFI